MFQYSLRGNGLAPGDCRLLYTTNLERTATAARTYLVMFPRSFRCPTRTRTVHNLLLNTFQYLVFVAAWVTPPQVVQDRNAGLAAGPGGGHEHIHCSLRLLDPAQVPLQIAVGERTGNEQGREEQGEQGRPLAVVAAKYYFNGDANVVFRHRLYSFHACPVRGNGGAEGGKTIERRFSGLPRLCWFDVHQSVSGSFQHSYMKGIHQYKLLSGVGPIVHTLTSTSRYDVLVCKNCKNENAVVGNRLLEM